MAARGARAAAGDARSRVARAPCRPLGRGDRYLSDFAISRPLADAEDDELGGAQRRDANVADQPTVIEIVLRHSRAVALDEISFLRLVTEEPATSPFVEKEILNLTSHGGP